MYRGGHHEQVVPIIGIAQQHGQETLPPSPSLPLIRHSPPRSGIHHRLGARAGTAPSPVGAIPRGCPGVGVTHAGHPTAPLHSQPPLSPLSFRCPARNLGLAHSRLSPPPSSKSLFMPLTRLSGGTIISHGRTNICLSKEEPKPQGSPPDPTGSRVPFPDHLSDG